MANTEMVIDSAMESLFGSLMPSDEDMRQILTERYGTNPPLLNLNQLLQGPLEVMIQRLQGIIAREFDTFSGICTGHARAFYDAYLGHVQRFHDTVSSEYGRAVYEFQSKLSQW
ncbi:hypothetical protein ACFLW8_03355 [Chloroflexota bacterium]